MTTTKPATPATPLPRIELGPHVDGGIFIAEEDCGQVIGMVRKFTHAEMIVAACNAYPRLMAERAELVAALQGLVKAEEAYGDENNVAVNHEWLRAREVLRKLGAE